ncbi:BREX-1 system adenine-specific DNA-methyltransferase PglX [Comamonas thiooxydans]|uniref:BREX-1 system adenine-specific DNA-methyltransferase PglX n=1 Tax=Comamonas thiooxydans TaxID=363952 RepID=UPI003EEEB638
MNKSNLKSYAPQARKDFIAAITGRAHQLGLEEHAGKLVVAPADTQGNITVIAGQAWPAKVNDQRKRLIERIQKDGFAQTMEAIAYTWFNRFAALRYMELHDYLGHGYRALSSSAASPGALPDLLTHAADIAHTASLPGLNTAQVLELKLAGNRDGELYRLLLVAQCNALSAAMPFLFERIDDDTELLLPDHLLRTDSIIAKLVAGVPEEDWQEIEVIGWLYQFYISEKKDQVIGKVVKSEDIPAATQLFTPNWIVQYLVQNSVGRLWLMANPASQLASEWPYYIAPAEQTPEVQAQLDALIHTRMAEDGDTLNPETITCLDPACGSGHILVVAYDVLKAIYLERGYRLRDIPRLILEKNLYGLDIDDRAAQLAGFALLMKARADDRRLLADPDNPPQLNILSLQESTGLDAQALHAALSAGHNPQASRHAPDAGFADTDLFPVTRPQMTLGEAPALPAPKASTGLTQQAIAELIATFEHAKTFGSLIQIGPQRLPSLRKQLSILKKAKASGDLYAQAAAKDLLPLVRQALVLGMQFDAVVANPPYMGGKYLTPVLKSYLKANYAGYEKDLFSAFMIRDLAFAKPTGQLGFMSPFVWMFISSYEELRAHFIDHATLTSLVQLEYSGFDGATVPICTFTLAKQHVAQFVGSYVRLSDFKGADLQGPKTLEAIQNKDCGWFYTAKPDDFKKIPGSPVAYWASSALIDVFAKAPKLEENVVTRKGMVTADNSKYVRAWYEVSIQKSGLRNHTRETAKKSGMKWFPYNKGGGFRKWYGNKLDVVNWENDGQLLQTNLHPTEGRVWATNFNLEFIFKPNVNWGAVTSSDFSARISLGGELFDAGGSAGFSDVFPIEYVLGFLNSKISSIFLKTLNPTLNFQAGNISDLPLINLENNQIVDLVSNAINISKNDWDASEISWDFRGNVLTINSKNCLKLAWIEWDKYSEIALNQLHTLETENNRLFINAYGLQDELSPEVPEDQITLTRADREKDCQRLISYAIGCMMGRYSLDAPGLIYAHAGNVGFDASRYPTFAADADGILPITDQPWFADDAPTRIREFLRAVWGPDTLEENLAWLAESLVPKASETPEETIRRYIADKFFKDHLQTYKKRPIYWLFSSGKQGAFQALVYLHRYNESTLARMRAEYVVPLTGKMQARIDMLQKDALAASSTAARNKINKEIEKLTKKHAELLAYDEKLRHYADMRIKLDLDDGVKVNYGKFGDLLDNVKLITGGSGDD